MGHVGFGFLEDDGRKTNYQNARMSLREYGALTKAVVDTYQDALTQAFAQKAVLTTELQEAHWRIEELEYELDRLNSKLRKDEEQGG